MAVAPKLSATERRLVGELRQAVKHELTPYYDTDFNLLRFARHYENNVDAAIARLRNHLALRNSFWNLDAMHSAPRNHPIHQHWKVGLTGPAGRTPNAIINVERTGLNDFFGMLSTYPPNEVIRARTYDFERFLNRVMQMESETGEQAGIYVVMDLAGLVLDKRLMKIIRAGVRNFSTYTEEHYPELVQRYFVVNAPPFMSIIWTIAQPILSERMRKKVTILGSNWRQKMLEVAVPEVLPECWNEKDSKVFKARVEAPMLFDVRGYYDGKLEDSTALQVRAGCVACVPVTVNKESTLRFAFLADGNFGFTVYRTALDEENNSELGESAYIKLSAVAGPLKVPLTDAILCAKEGLYKFCFDNRHAWLHSLNIQYVITVE